MQTFFNKYKKNYFSQNGEDGIIEEALKRIQPSFPKHMEMPLDETSEPKEIQTLQCAEFGAADGIWCSNTRALVEKGWDAFLYDSSPRGDVKYGNIDSSNVNYFIPDDVNLLSIDVDGDDFFIWEAYKGKPAIVIIEINSSIPPKSERAINGNHDGCGYRQMVMLGIKKEYFVLCHTGNIIFVHSAYKELFPEIVGNPLEDVENFFNSSWLKK